MKIVLETRKGTEDRKKELNKLKWYIKADCKYTEEKYKTPFGCSFYCEDKECEECVEEHIKKVINKIDEEGVLYI